MLALSALVLAAPLLAQDFVQQTLIVAPLRGDADLRLAQQVAARLRTRIARLSNKRELHVPSGDTTESILEFAGYKPDTVLGERTLVDLAHLLRADEIIVGHVIGKRPGPVEIRAELVLVRDWRLRQPLPVIKAATMALAADSLGSEIVRARTQMAGLRRCENATRQSDPARAAAMAASAVASYSSSTLARTCLAVALASLNAPPDSVLAVTAAVLALDSMSIIAAVLHAEQLSALKRAKEAAGAWTRIVNQHADSLELGFRALNWMLRLYRPSDAVPTARLLLTKFPGEPGLRRLLFGAFSSLSDFKNAAALGDSLDAIDPEFRDDSVFEASHIVALRAVGDTLGAVAKSARSAKLHPNDPVIYLEYLQLVAGENGSAIRRGLEKFPDVPELHVLAATSARTVGNAASEIASLREAVRLDSLMTRGYLRMAELWFSAHRLDSALATLARTPRSGDGADLLRAYAIGRGMQVLRSATDTTADTWHTTISLFALADSVDSRTDTRSLIAATTLQLAQRELVTASKTHQCADTKNASKALSWADAAISRGVGDDASASELRDAYSKLSVAAESFSKSYCSTPAGGSATGTP